MATPIGNSFEADPFAPPLAQVAVYSDRASNLCDLLEAIADDLPKMAPSKWRVVIVQSLVIIPKYYEMIARVLLPAMLQKRDMNTESLDVLRRLHADYLEAEACIPELQALLSDAGKSTQTPVSPDAIGYALRGFFEAIRRQTIWDKEILLPFASRHLDPKDLEVVSAALNHINGAQHPTSI